MKAPPPIKEKGACNCSLQCFKNVLKSRIERKRLREEFQALPDRKSQEAWLLALIDLKSVAPPKPGSPALHLAKRKPRTHVASYHLKLGGRRRVRVCVHAFCATLGIGQSRLKRLNHHVWNTNTATPTHEKRGKRTPANKLSDELNAQIDAHIESFPKLGSHYALVSKYKYLPADLSRRAMWLLFLKEHEPEVHAALAATEVHDADELAKEDETLDAKDADDEPKAAPPKARVKYGVRDACVPYVTHTTHTHTNTHTHTKQTYTRTHTRPHARAVLLRAFQAEEPALRSTKGRHVSLVRRLQGAAQRHSATAG